MAKQRKKGAIIFTSILSLLIAALIVVTVCLYVFNTENGAYAHTHKYSETYRYDDDYHWFPAICVHDDLVKDKEPHSYVFDHTVPPTCRERGYDVYKCICGKTEIRNYTDTVSHVYADGFCKFCGQKAPSGELTLELDASGDFYAVTKALALKDPDVIIPSTHGEGVDAKPVVKIAERAFENSNVTGVIIPASVTEIGNLAFSGCTGLEKVTFPKELTKIGWSIFVGCSSLKEIEYTGTKAEWEELIRSTAWSGDMTVSCTIKCLDETIIYTPPATV